MGWESLIQCSSSEMLRILRQIVALGGLIPEWGMSSDTSQKHQESVCVEYLETIFVSSSGLPFASRNFSVSLLVESRLTGDSGK